MRASQAGNANWNPAANVNRTFAISEPPVAGNYCEATSSQPWVEWIANVNLANLDNASSKCHNGCGYSDFTNLSANVSKSSSYPLQLTPGLSWSGYNPNLFWRVWIDYNQDGDFTDAGETVFSGISPSGTDGSAVPPVTGNINIPVSAQLGMTRMRVSMKKEAYAGPCESYVFGEVEDYTITIGGPGTAPQLLVFNGARDPEGVRLDWATDAEKNNEYFILERAADGTNYQELIQVDSEYDDEGVFTYAELDTDPIPGRNYYRLKVFQLDGSYHYSLPATVYYSPRERDVLIFPNPATDHLKLSIPFYAGSAGELMIVNNLGQVVYRQDVASIPLSGIEISTADFTNGLYIVSLKVGEYKRMSGQVIINREY